MAKRLHAGYNDRGANYAELPIVGVFRFVETVRGGMNIFVTQDIFGRFDGKPVYVTVFADKEQNRKVYEMMLDNQEHLGEVTTLHESTSYHKYPNKPGMEVLLSNGTSIEAHTVGAFMVAKRNPALTTIDK